MPTSRRSTWFLIPFAVAIAGLARAADEPIVTEQGLVFPDGAAIPRYLTGTERAWLATHPLATTRALTPPPQGPVYCPAEYDPMAGLIISWEGSASWTSILAQIAKRVTVEGASRIWCMVDSTTVRTSAQNSINAAGADPNRVTYIVRTMDTIWCRDYGPRYIYEGNVRAIVDHTYNRPRPNDDGLPGYLAALWKKPLYDVGLIHGGGNYHLSGLGDSYATRLIANENPGLGEPNIIARWQAFQNLNTTITDPFPTSIDSTQHIDMWMEIIADRKVIISEWPDPNATQAQICNNTAASMQAAGYTVYRTPARSISGVHYTYTNMVICNNVVLVPSYTNATMVPLNTTALNAITGAFGAGYTVIQIPCEAIVSAAGVMHCIVMHVPANLTGANPNAYLRNPRGDRFYLRGSSVDIRWSSDDDESVSNVDLLLSTDGGASFPTTIAAATADDGLHAWTVPNISTGQARVRVLARDALGNTGFDQSESNFTISCAGDSDGNGAIDQDDLDAILFAFGTTRGQPGFIGAADFDGNDAVDQDDLDTVLFAFGSACP